LRALAPAANEFSALLSFCAGSAVGFVGTGAFFSAFGMSEDSTFGALGASDLTGSMLELFSATGLPVRILALAAAESGRASCEEMIAGSTGAPGTVGWPVGGRLAGGVYLLAWPLESGEKSRRTPLYLDEG
jgi:hypothetical protein